MKKRIIAIVLSIILCYSCVLPVFAVDEEPESEPETVTSEDVTEAPATEPTTEKGGLSFDFSVEDLLNSEIVLGILASDGFMELMNIVIEVMAKYNKENIENMTKEEMQKLIQSVFDTVADAVIQFYGNKDLLIKYDFLKVLENLFDIDEDVLPTRPHEEPTKDPNELEIGLGDVDGDGKVTAADARQILRRAAKLVVFTMEQDALADVDKDGVVTAKDARIVLRFSAGLISADSYGFLKAA